ncbi:MAG: DUF45 domain-containing protein [Mariprofundus sp.]|nr:DUF45 domain-containing protein [Mariprofundus sp.]
MRPKPPPSFLAGYSFELTEKIRELIVQNQLGEILLQKYPLNHSVRSDKALYDYVLELKEVHLRNAGPLHRVAFDSKLMITRNALGMHTSKSQVHGAKLKAKRELHVATMFKDMPPEFLRMIVVHELSHIKVADHNKSFYKLCCHMEPEYHQLEFDLRVYLTYLEAAGTPLWPHPQFNE